MRCTEARHHLDAYRTGEAGRSRRIAIRRHLASCPSCRRELDELESLEAWLHAARRGAPAGMDEYVHGRTVDRYGPVETTLGNAWVSFGIPGATMIQLGGIDASGFEGIFRRAFSRPLERGVVPQDLARAVRRAAEGKPFGAARLDLSPLPSFKREVLEILRQVPRGQVRTYSWLARESGKPAAVRAVGNIMAGNPLPLLIPCHRIVPAAGGVGHYAFGNEIKRELLRREGVPLAELDRLADRGARYLGCVTTRICCFPTCRHIRRARPENRRPFPGLPEALEAGYRPCRDCRPS